MNEPEQIQNALQGDQQAWATLIAAHQEAVFRLAYLMVRDAAAADRAIREHLQRAQDMMRATPAELFRHEN